MKIPLSKLAVVCLSCAILCISQVALAQTKVEEARIWNAPDHSRLVFELSGPAKHKVFMLTSPHRLVLDISHSRNAAKLQSLDLANSPVIRLRSAKRNSSDLRVVLDLNEKVNPRSFLLAANDQYGDRLVVDLYKTSVAAKPAPKKSFDIIGNQRDVIVVIDPGHGGEDPGAIGPGRVKEKDIVLAISKELKRQLNEHRGFKAVLTRETDYYIGLRKRTQIARKHNADLLVSVHADAFVKAQANGASVFALSNRGATSETARWLAKKENAADLIGGVGGVSLGEKDDVLASVLLDLSSTASLKASLGVGGNVLSSMGKVARLHKRKVQQAGFAVLKSPDIPSILVETGFISNPAESRRLKTRKYQKSIAKAISKGVVSHFKKVPPPGSYLAHVQNGGAKPGALKGVYVVRSGDTLSRIAQKNAVSIEKLRRINGINGDRLLVGQKLKLPAS